MPSTLTLTFRRFKRSGALDAGIREMADRLRRCEPRITEIRVTVLGRLEGAADDAPVAVKIHLSVPGAQIHAESMGPADATHADVFTVLWAAYENARNQLRSLVSGARVTAGPE